MKVIESSGSAREIGFVTGEALRDEIHEHLDMRSPWNEDAWRRRRPAFMETLERHLPEQLEEMEGTAEGAGVSIDSILQLNVPAYANNLVTEGCTNIVFSDGPDGPLWGKNNDGMNKSKSLPVCCRIVSRDNLIPVVIFTFAGMVSTTDGMNAAGVAVGHSSVGCVFQQSDRFVPVRLWAYECMMRSRTTEEFVQLMAGLPTRGKGYSHVVVDSRGVMCSIEAPCPLLQVRRPEDGVRHMNCTNYYQLPALAEADRRKPDGKCNAIERKEFLEQTCSELEDYSLDDMKKILRHHGDTDICRHGKGDTFTEYSMIGLPETGQVLYLDGNPCESEFEEIQLYELA